MPVNGFARFAYFLLRVVAGLLFMQAGGVKLLDWFGGMAAAGQPPLEVGSQIWSAGWWSTRACPPAAGIRNSSALHQLSSPEPWAPVAANVFPSGLQAYS